MFIVYDLLCLISQRRLFIIILLPFYIVTCFDTVLFYILFILFILLTMHYFHSLIFRDFYPFYYLLHFSLYDGKIYFVILCYEHEMNQSLFFFFNFKTHLNLILCYLLFKISDLIWALTIGKIDFNHGFIL